MLVSARDFKPTFSEDEFENVYRDMQRVYLVTLAKETESPLGPRATKWARRTRKTRTQGQDRQEVRRDEDRERSDDEKERRTKRRSQ